ncbi:uncharacterized protein F5Z01DRAFT_547462 [Emericellopsis atlantica]|uniref:NWD NACHT-NTPase N-terminal domain-containing protein n=1 Tax=Emericellopsis atlantica TaxID=2614577 RepID=A0A9P8CQE7_9HYPO|nr:uncharacterized protein F5Z01DRAFT_547462 [Emericellopsis atlantica]KAG9255553.1 hypothetical protein F5Z01DRAFT_547462 [Emericellopsis atlantica]
MLTEQQQVSVEKPSVLKRLVGRARSKSDLSRNDSVSSIASNVSNLSRSTTGGSVASTTERSRGRMPSFKTPSFKVGSSSSSSASPPARKKLSVPSVRPHPEAALSRDLWDEAYDALRLDPSTASLVVTYESIISQELPEDVKSVVRGTLSPSDGNTDRRLDLMTAIATAGLSKRRGSKSSEVDDSTPRTLEHTKRIVESQLEDFPSTALAWAGLCTLTPLLLDPILGHAQFRRGMVHVIGRIPWYMHLTHLMQCPSWVDAGDFEARQHEFAVRRDRSRDAITKVYRRVLEFEMNCVCAAASAWNSVAKHAVRWKTIDKMVDGIYESDEAARELVNELVVEGPRRQKMATRDVDLDVDALDKLRQQEQEDLDQKIPEDRPL